LISHNNQGDRILFYSHTDPYPVLALATGQGVDLNEDYVPNGGATLEGTLSRSGATFTVTIGPLVSGAVKSTAPPAAVVTWNPSSAATDFLAKACSTTSRNETGASDREF
jgi:hypothetical protein